MQSNSEGGFYEANRLLRLALGALLLLALVLLVYRPLLPGSFVMDDARLIGGDNPLVNGELTPLNIWFRTDFTLTNLAWRIEGLIFSGHPAGYHFVNLALQALSAFLLWRLLARLKIPGAWVAAALFAVHPVCVNSVARVAELKNTLALPFCLLSFWAYLHYEALALYPPDGKRESHYRPTVWLVLSLAAYVLSLLSKTTAVTLPVVMLLCAVWQRGKATWRDWLHAGPYFILALAFGLMTMWFQKYQALGGEPLAPVSFLARLAGAGQNFCFYLGKALLPVRLSVYYAHQQVEAASLAAFLPALLIGVVFLVCWGFRRTWGRHALFGLGCFGVALFPVLGFFDAQFLQKVPVSDHLQYEPMIAVVALVTGMLAAVLPRKIFWGVAAALILAFSALSSQRARVFASEENLMRDAIAKDPAAWLAHNDLGVLLAKRGDYPAAINEFTASLKSQPGNFYAERNLGQALALQGKFAEAEQHCLAALKQQPFDPQTHEQFAEALEAQGRWREALLHLQIALCFNPTVETRQRLAALLFQTGDFRQALAQFRRILAAKPDDVEALNNLAWILATCPDDRLRDGTEAVRLAERACELTGYKQPGTEGTLAAAYAEAGRFPDAVSTAERAISLATATGDTRFAAANRQLLLLYRAGKPWHEKPANPANQSPAGKGG
jgi:Flp pilus assembly protein TadD